MPMEFLFFYWKEALSQADRAEMIAIASLWPRSSCSPVIQARRGIFTGSTTAARAASYLIT